MSRVLRLSDYYFYQQSIPTVTRSHDLRQSFAFPHSFTLFSSSFLSAPHCHFFHSPFSSFSHFFHLFFFIVPSLHHLIHLQSSPPLKISPHSPPANP